MQSKVADMNSAVVTYRTNLMAARKAQDTNAAKMCVYGTNELLAEELQYEFDSDAYRMEREQMLSENVRCPRCKELTKITKQNVRFDVVITKLTRRPQSYRYVICKNKPCGTRVYLLDKTRALIVGTSSEEKYLPEPPRISNLAEQVSNYSRFWAWLDMVWPKLEGRHRQYREQVSKTEQGDIE